MPLLLLIGFAGGLVTGISPCILPVLPLVLAGVASGENSRRPYLIIGGLVLSFTIFTLAGGALLSALGLPQDLLRNIAIALLLVVAAGLIVPKLGSIIERPFARLGLRRQPGARGGFLLGISLGLVYVPCAGPILAAIVVAAARHRVGVQTILVTAAYAAGNAVPLLAIALASRRASTKLSWFRAHAARTRQIAGVVMAAAALALFFNVFDGLQTKLPGYAAALQNKIETGALKNLDGAKPAALADNGPAPEFKGVRAWLNSEPLTLAKLRGKVVLVDFWTYSCINCIRTLPHVESWYRTYQSKGFVVVGVHTPEFAFEHVVSNVRSAAARLGVVYPIAIDNDFATWNAYNNEYWPAEYLIDARGHVRHSHFGEGDYDGTETAIRTLLDQIGATLPPPVEKNVKTGSARPTTPETYLGYSRLDRYEGSPIQKDKEATYAFPATLDADAVSLAGRWTVGEESAVAGRDARLRLRCTARQVFLVLGGRGMVRVTLDRQEVKTVQVGGEPREYVLGSNISGNDHLLEIAVSPGVEAFDFTFG